MPFFTRCFFSLLLSAEISWQAKGQNPRKEEYPNIGFFVKNKGH
jgi:hypothetical protein